MDMSQVLVDSIMYFKIQRENVETHLFFIYLRVVVQIIVLYSELLETNTSPITYP